MLLVSEYQTALARASEIQPGDWLDRIEPNDSIAGPRGGRYRFDGITVGGKVERVAWVSAGEELDIRDDWRPARVEGFRIYVRDIFRPDSPRRVTLPGNLADLTGAVVRREQP